MRKFILSVATSLLLSLPAYAEDMLKGVFQGASGHETAGSVEILQVEGKWLIRLGADFVHDGTAPDATVALGKDGYDAATNLGKLRANAGTQDYVLPEGFDPAGYNEVYIWCKQFSVSLGVATLG